MANNETVTGETYEEYQEVDAESQYEEGEEEGEEDDGSMGLDEALSGTRAAAEFTEPAIGTHTYYVRPHFRMNVRENPKPEGGKPMKAWYVDLLMEVLATESEAAMSSIGGILRMSFPFKGQLVDYPNYPAAKQLADGKANVLLYLKKFTPDAGAGVLPSAKMALVDEIYQDVCAKVVIKAKASKEYVNIRSVRVMKPVFGIINTASEGEVPNGLFDPSEAETVVLFDWDNLK